MKRDAACTESRDRTYTSNGVGHLPYKACWACNAHRDTALGQTEFASVRCRTRAQTFPSSHILLVDLRRRGWKAAELNRINVCALDRDWSMFPILVCTRRPSTHKTLYNPTCTEPLNRHDRIWDIWYCLGIAKAGHIHGDV
jgi:hypothetical protein